jgi:hypothetical protein
MNRLPPDGWLSVMDGSRRRAKCRALSLDLSNLLKWNNEEEARRLGRYEPRHGGGKLRVFH